MDNRAVSNKSSQGHSYKAKGQGIRTDPLANRFRRANRMQEERKKTRAGKVNEKRRLPLSPLQDSNVTMSQTLMIADTEESQPKRNLESQNNRKEMLMKWREEKKLKQKIEALNNSKKKTFVTGQVKYKLPPTLTERSTTKLVKMENTTTKDAPAKRITRASARLAQKQVSVRSKSPPKKPAPSRNSKLQKQKETKAQTQKIAVKSSEPAKSCVRTRAQLLKKKQEENTMKKSDKREVEQIVRRDVSSDKDDNGHKDAPPVTEKSSQDTFPDFEAVKNIISFGRGSTEGDSRTVQQVLSSEKEPIKSDQQSFAPTDFKFTVPTGINSFVYNAANFQFKPLSPKSASAFLFPSSASFYDSPKTTPFISVKTDEKMGAKIEFNLEGTSANPIQSQEVKSGSHTDANEVTSAADQSMKNCHIDKVNKENISVTQMDTSLNVECDSTYFRNLLKSETTKLHRLCNKWEEISESETELTEEVCGQIRTVIGQAQLLVDQRFKQFSGLIDLSENKTAEKKATCSDLQGFWDMIYFQVEDVIVKFDNLDKLRANNWMEEKKKLKTKGKKLKNKKKAMETTEPSKEQPGKNRVQEMRAAMKAKMKEEKAKLAEQNSSNQTENVAFFTVLTPVKRKKASSEDNEKEVVLTPVRRSARKTRSRQSVHIVSTPKLHDGPVGSLRLTPEGTAPPDTLKQSDTNEETTVEDTIKPDPDCIPEISKGIEDISSTTELSGKRMVANRRSRVSFVEISPETTSTQTPTQSTNEDDNVVCTPVISHSEATKLSKSIKRSVNRRRSLTRGRIPTPYYPRRSTSRIKDKDDLLEVDSSAVVGHTNTDDTDTSVCSEVATTTPVNGSAKKSAIKHNRSQSNSKKKLHSGDLFVQDSPLIPTTEIVEDFTSKYLSATDNNSASELDSTNDSFEDNGCQKEMSDDSLEFLETGNQSSGPRVSVLGSEPRAWRTPKNLISCLSDLDTPSPSSCPITPLPPKTTWFISPLQNENNNNNVTPYTPESPISPSGEGTERKSVLVELTPEVTNSRRHHSKIASKLETLHIQSPALTFDARRDSVFFAPVTTASDSSASVNSKPERVDNLISFSPGATEDSSQKEDQECGSVKRFAAITPSKKMRSFLGTDCVLSPVRRSARLHMDDSTSVSSLQVTSVSELPADLEFGYQPNPQLTNN